MFYKQFNIYIKTANEILTPDTGKVFIQEKEISNLTQKKLTDVRRKHIGFIFQNHQLLPYLKVEEQLILMQQMSKSHNKDELHELLSDLGLNECKNRYPKQLSGGERQRTAIARAFINHPDLILADEPTASLDAKRGYQVVEMIRNEVKKYKKAGILVTLDERVLDLVDKVFYLKNGTLIEK